MFKNCRLFTDDLSHWNVSSLRNTESMFENCALFNANLSHWDVGGVIDCRDMFSGCAQFTATLAHWDMRAYFGHRYPNAPVFGSPPDSMFTGPQHRRLWTTQQMIMALGFWTRTDDADHPPMPRLPQDRAMVPPLPPLPPLPPVIP